jgi:hypothetical protein
MLIMPRKKLNIFFGLPPPRQVDKTSGTRYVVTITLAEKFFKAYLLTHVSTGIVRKTVTDPVLFLTIQTNSMKRLDDRGH